jgi:hypothetical protein
VAEPVIDYIITAHAAFEMQRRGIDEAELRDTLTAPEQRFTVRLGRDVLQARITVAGTTYLLRAFVDVDRQPAEVVTVYRTTKIERYWRNEP